MHQTAIATSIIDKVARQTLEWKIHWLFRLACFVNLSAMAPLACSQNKPGSPIFTLFGIPGAWAWRLMPVVGGCGYPLGTLTLVAPIRAALLYMTIWGFFTALLRPLAGKGGGVFERAYNFGVPGLMLWMHSAGTACNTWFTVITDIPRLTVARAQQYQWALRALWPACSLGMADLGW